MNHPSHDMYHDLITAASDLSDAAIEMLGIAVRLSTAGMNDEALKLISMASAVGAIEDVAKSYANEISIGLVVRTSVN
ncbi:hypothetical protein CCL21_11740 [Pseudomonas syringae]|uniref:hypothetical protein n=1 Tax=Pseudomonas syringae TaxID=317 RepID=UPI000BB65908|nr:hypothetical protein [Pseudomonas syringae]PBP70031.1 hypothetical protein CCL21_11740 [Pseudomonas syringae]